MPYLTIQNVGPKKMNKENRQKLLLKSFKMYILLLVYLILHISSIQYIKLRKSQKVSSILNSSNGVDVQIEPFSVKQRI